MPSHFCTIKHKKKGYTECRFWMLLNFLKSYTLWNHSHENISEVVAFNVKSLACLSFSLAAFFARDERRTALNVDVIINFCVRVFFVMLQRCRGWEMKNFVVISAMWDTHRKYEKRTKIRMLMFPFSQSELLLCNSMHEKLDELFLPPERTRINAKHQVCHNQSMSNATYKIIQFE